MGVIADLAKQVIADFRESEDRAVKDALGKYRRACGRWPEFTTIIYPAPMVPVPLPTVAPTTIDFEFSIAVGPAPYTPKPGERVRVVRSGVLNDREVPGVH